MTCALTKRVFLGVLAALLSGCAGTPGVKYQFNPPGDGSGYRFVIPRTVVKVSQGASPAPSQPGAPAAAGGVAPKDALAPRDPVPPKVPPDRTAANLTKLSFTPVPVVTDRGGQPLPVYSVTDDTGGFSWVSTSITNVKYADYLIVQSIGTQVTDNRKDAIDTIVSLVGVAATAFGFAEGTEVKCTNEAPYQPLADFVIEDFSAESPAPIPAPNNTCWGYKITDFKDVDAKAKFPIPADGSSALPLGTKTSWFPYPACKSVTISVFPCETSNGATSCKEPTKQEKAAGARAIAVLSVADGTAFRRVALPQKGKVDMHSDFCVADVTSDTSPLSSDWTLLSQAIKDVKGLKKGSSSSSSSNPASPK
jgi:hypothetical protein